jgi:hypothetical protein
LRRRHGEAKRLPHLGQGHASSHKAATTMKESQIKVDTKKSVLI